MTVAPLLVRSLLYGGILAGVVAITGSLLGGLTAGGPGLAGGLLGAGLGALFLALTALSILIAGRVTGGDLTSPAFYGIVLGIWAVKLIIFFVISLWLRTQDWIDPVAFSFTAIAAVVCLLIADAFALLRSRIPLDVSLPDGERPAE